MAREMLRRAQAWGLVATGRFVLVFVAFAVRYLLARSAGQLGG